MKKLILLALAAALTPTVTAQNNPTRYEVKNPSSIDRTDIPVVIP